MKSEWKVTSNLINGQTMYGVYRLLDTKGIDHSGNREMYGNYTTDRKWAEKQASKLNQGGSNDKK